MNRRQLLKTSAIGVATATLATLASCTKKEKAPTKEPVTSEGTAGGEELQYLDSADNVASTLGYAEDASTVDASVRVDKGETKGVDQVCTNCRFYSAEDSTSGEGGKCQLFPGKLVKAKGWCKSWALAQK